MATAWRRSDGSGLHAECRRSSAARRIASRSDTLARARGLAAAEDRGDSHVVEVVEGGSRSGRWRTMPTCRRRNMVRSVSDMSARSVDPTWTGPESGRLSPARRWSRVDLPDPEGPSTATISPASTVSQASWRATTAAQVLVKVRATPTARSIGVVNGSSPGRDPGPGLRDGCGRGRSIEDRPRGGRRRSSAARSTSSAPSRWSRSSLIRWLCAPRCASR